MLPLDGHRPLMFLSLFIHCPFKTNKIKIMVWPFQSQWLLMARDTHLLQQQRTLPHWLRSPSDNKQSYIYKAACILHKITKTDYYFITSLIKKQMSLNKTNLGTILKLTCFITNSSKCKLLHYVANKNNNNSYQMTNNWLCNLQEFSSSNWFRGTEMHHLNYKQQTKKLTHPVSSTCATFLEQKASYPTTRTFKKQASYWYQQATAHHSSFSIT